MPAKPRLKLLLDGRIVPAESSVGLRLRGIRGEHGLTGEAMAERVYVSRATWSALENNRVAPSRKLLQALRREFGVRDSYVLSGTPPIYEGSAA